MDTHQIVSLRIAYYFVKQHDYRLLTINQNQGELFLLNPAHDKYPVIRIDTTGTPLSVQKITALNQFMVTQQPLIRGNNQLLSLTLKGEAEHYDNHDIVLITQDSISDPSLYDEFKGLSKVDWQVSNPIEELRQVVAALNKETQSLRTKTNFLTAMKNTKAISIFSAISVVFFILTVLMDTVTGNRINSLIILGGFYKPFVLAGYEIWRFVTAGFLHSDILHLLANVLALNNIGMILEKIYGVKKIVITILVSIIMGNMFVHIADTTALTIGLSGGVYGLFGLLIVYAFESGFIRQPTFRNQLTFIIIINVMINFLPYVSWLGHLGGLVSGLMLGLLYSRVPRWKALRSSAQKASILLIIMLLTFSVIRPAQSQVYGGTDNEVIEVLENKFNLTWYTNHLKQRLIKYYESRGVFE